MSVMDTFVFTAWPAQFAAAAIWAQARMSPGYSPEQAAQVARTARFNPGFRVAFDSPAGKADSSVVFQEETHDRP